MIAIFITKNGLIQRVLSCQLQNKSKKLLILSILKKAGLSFTSMTKKVYFFLNLDEDMYLDVVNRSLINYKIDERLKKNSGFSYFLVNYEIDKADMAQ